jgi:hypothetical protein
MPPPEPMRSDFMFNFDWFHGPGLRRQIEEAKIRCAARSFDARQRWGHSTEYQAYKDALETRTVSTWDRLTR